MGMDASLICFGPKGVLAEFDCLNYPANYYLDVSDDAIVAGTIAVACTEEQSILLAELCGVEPWALDTHHITKVARVGYDDDDWIGNDSAGEIYINLSGLLKHPEVAIWYLPNG